MLNFTLHAECGDVIICTLNKQDTAEFIIHFNGYITYVVFDSRAENVLVIVASDFFDTVISDTLSEECSEIIWLYCPCIAKPKGVRTGL